MDLVLNLTRYDSIKKKIYVVTKGPNFSSKLAKQIAELAKPDSRRQFAKCICYQDKKERENECYIAVNMMKPQSTLRQFENLKIQESARHFGAV